MRYWLMKSEPDEFSIDDLKRVKREGWSGVRNYQARNFMRDEMKCGDMILFYHSSCRPPGVAGIAKVSKESHPDPSAFNQKSAYYDEKSSPEKPRWFMVEVEFVEKFKKYVTLDEIKERKTLSQMKVIQKGSRLSITPVTKKEFDTICKMGQA